MSFQYEHFFLVFNHFFFFSWWQSLTKWRILSMISYRLWQMISSFLYTPTLLPCFSPTLFFLSFYRTIFLSFPSFSLFSSSPARLLMSCRQGHDAADHRGDVRTPSSNSLVPDNISSGPIDLRWSILIFNNPSISREKGSRLLSQLSKVRLPTLIEPIIILSKYIWELIFAVDKSKPFFVQRLAELF